MLEDRTLLSGNTLALAQQAPLQFTDDLSTASGYLAASNDVQLYQISLNPGDVATASVQAQSIGSGLNSYLRVFNASGQQLFANDNFDGTASSITFQASPGDSVYYMGVSASGNASYDPTTAPNLSQANLQVGATSGLFQLTVTVQPGQTSVSDLTAASFSVSQSAALPGDTVGINYRIENRGGTASGSYTVDVLLSTDNRFDIAGNTTVIDTITGQPGLAADGSFTATTPLLVTLPALLAGSSYSGTYYIGLEITPGGATGSNLAFNNNAVSGTGWAALNVLSLYTNGSPLLNGWVAGDPAPLSGTQSFTINVPQNGILTATVQNTTGTTQLTLLQNGQPLIQSAGATDSIQQFLTAGTYVLEVTPLSGSPLYRISTVFTPGNDPTASIPLPNLDLNPDADDIVSADFTGDGIPDLAISLIGSYTDFVVLPGLGNGNFGNPIPTQSPTGQPTVALYTADFTNNGLADIVTVDLNGTVSVLLSQGNGQFTPSPDNNLDNGAFFATTTSLFVPGPYPLVAIGDFNNDGKMDLAIGVPGSGGTGQLFVYLGNGDGTFTPPSQPITITNDFEGPLAVGQFYTKPGLPNSHEIGQLDITAASGTMLLGNGNGTFTQIPDRTIASLGGSPNPADSIAVADLNGDGYPDLIEAPQNYAVVLGDPLKGFITVSYGNGNGTFSNPVTLNTPDPVGQMVAADFNGDGIWDVALEGNTSISVLLGTGRGGSQPFQPAQTFTLPLAADFGDAGFAIGDFNGDGQVDIATANNPEIYTRTSIQSVSAVSVLFGAGDGTFVTDTNPELDADALALVAGDFTNNGLDDLASANLDGNDISMLLSEGNGFFQFPVDYAWPAPGASAQQPSLLISGDFNGDGRLDLAAFFPWDGPPDHTKSGYFAGTVAVFYGVGDGTFTFGTQLSVYEPTNTTPSHMFAADLTGDGLSDIIIGQTVYLTSRTTNGITFTQQATFLPGQVAAVGDFTANNVPDLLVDNNGEEVLLGNGDGTFTPGVILGTQTGDTQLGDFNDDGITDVAVETSVTVNKVNTATISIYIGAGNGNFTPGGSIVATSLNNFVVGDFSSDGYDDIAVLIPGPELVVYINNENGTFTESSQVLPVPKSPTAMVVGDFTGDGRLDIAIASWLGGPSSTSQLTILLGVGNGTFVDPAIGTDAPSQAVPLVGDVNGDGAPDVVVLDAQGDILFRPGIPGETGVFGPPILVNPDTPARDVALLTDTVNGVTTVRIAALDLDDDNISIYSLGADGQFTLTGTLATGLLPTRIVSADLNGDGLGDLIVVNSGDNDLTVYLADPSAPTGFDPSNYALAGGSGPFDVTTAPLGNGGEDILVSNAINGTIGIFLNQGNGTFGAEQLFAAGAGPFGMSSSNTVASLAATEGLVVGQFDESDNGLDVVAVNANTDTFSLLDGNGNGTLGNPTTFLAGSQPTLVATGDFNNDGHLDLAILNQATDTISIYLGDGQGHFTAGQVLSAGNAPTGLSVADVDGDGKLDLLVGNSYGDVLILRGNGDGTFEPYQRLNSYVSLAVFNQSGQSNVVLGNQGQDRISMQNAQGVNTPLLSRNNSLLAPQVFQADINLDGYEDLIVLNSGGNSINVYFGGPNGIDYNHPQTYFVGTNPDFVLVSDINGDGIPDLLVANQGSNDVSILFGTGQKNANGSISNWSATIGPRIAVGAGPNSLALANVVHIDPVTGQTELGPSVNGLLDLIVSNQGSNSLWIVPGVGDGFFKDNGAIVVPGLSGQLLLNGNGAFLVDGATGAVHFIPDLTDPTTNFTLDGLDAVSGITGEFGDGTSDALVVTETGIADLILGDADGISIAANFDTTLKDPGEMALSAQQAGLFSFYVSYVNTQNVEAAQQFALELRGGDLVAVATQLNLSAVDDSSLALVALLVSSNGTSAPDETAAGSSPEILSTGNSSALAQTLLDLDSHYTPNDGGNAPSNAATGNAALFGSYLQQGLSSVGSQLQAEIALASRLLPVVLAEVGTALETGLGGVGSDAPRLSWALLAPFREIGKLSVEAIKEVGQTTIHGFGKPTGLSQSALPSPLEPAVEPAAALGAPIMPLDLFLAMSILGGDAPRRFDAEEELPRTAIPLVQDDSAEVRDLLPAAMLAAGIAGGWWMGGEPDEKERPGLRG